MKKITANEDSPLSRVIDDPEVPPDDPVVLLEGLGVLPGDPVDVTVGWGLQETVSRSLYFGKVDSVCDSI